MIDFKIVLTFTSLLFAVILIVRVESIADILTWNDYSSPKSEHRLLQNEHQRNRNNNFRHLSHFYHDNQLTTEVNKWRLSIKNRSPMRQYLNIAT